MKVTVKTIDSGSKEFELPDETTVLTLKDEILKQMGIPLHQQRLIFQGKVLKDEKTLKEYGVESKVLHLVKRPPPTSSEATSTTTAEVQPTPNVVGEMNATQDLLFVGTSMPSQTELTQVTQNIVDRIVNSLSSQGADAQVTAETVTMDSSGRIHTASLSARSDVRVTTVIHPTTTTTITTSISQQQPIATSKKNDTPPQQPPQQPPEAPSTASTVPPQEEANETVEDAEAREALRQRMVKRDRQENHTIYTHARTVKRCFTFANKVLDRFDRGSARVKAMAAQEMRGGTSEQMEQEEWPEVEPMDILEASSEPAASSSAAQSGATKERDELYKELEDPDMPDFKASLLSVMMDDLEAVQCRLRPLIIRYQVFAVQDRELTEAESVIAAQVAITVRDVIYYIGHGYVSLSRLHINFLIPPPRLLHLAAPHKTEMRRVMQSMRRCFPTMMPPLEEPSGYIVDISRDNTNAEGSTASGTTTRAVVNKRQLDIGGGLAGFGGMYGPMLGGVMSGRGVPPARGIAQEVPRTTVTKKADDHQKKGGGEEVEMKDALEEVKEKEPGAFGMAAEKLIDEDVSCLSEAEIGRRDKRAKRMEEQLAMTVDAEKAAFIRNEEDVKRREASRNKYNEEKEKREEEEEKRKAEEEVKRKAEEEVKRKAEEEVKRKAEEEKMVVSAAVQQSSNDGGASDAPQESATNPADETPRYLARLLSELITGVADPAGPHRSGQGAAPDAGGTSPGEATVKNSNEAATPGEKTGASDSDTEGNKEGNKECGGGDAPRRSFAERYAGPEGTTVTIAAAPSAQLGFRMEGPSLSIKNPGAGEEPKMTINLPVPPAMHLLQALLQRAHERHRERQANGESSASSTSSEEDDELEEGATGEAMEPEKKKKKRSRPKVPRPFVKDDGEVGSTDEAGEMDSADKEGPVDFNHAPTLAGEHMTMMEAMAEVRGKIRVENAYDSDEDDENPSSVSLFEHLLRILSRELTVGEVMKILQGDVDCLERTQSDFLEFVKDKVLDGAEPTKERKGQAVNTFLKNFEPSMEAILPTLPIRDPGIDFIKTNWKLFCYVVETAYDHIINACSLREQINHVFAKRMQGLANRATELFACIARHCVDGDHIFDDLVGKMVSKMFPPSTPPAIVKVCIESVLKWLYKAREDASFMPMELDRYLVWKDGYKTKPNHSYTLHMFTKNGMQFDTKLKLPYPPEESCPGGETDSVNGVPPGVPQEWVATIDEDGKAHPRREGPQQPYSDAYLSGMPAKRRKLDTSEPCTIISDDLAYDAMEAALLRSGVETFSGAADIQMLSLVHQNSVIGGGVSAEVHRCHQERLKSEGVDKQQYPNAMEFYSLDLEKYEDRLDN